MEPKIESEMLHNKTLKAKSDSTGKLNLAMTYIFEEDTLFVYFYCAL